MIAKSTVIKGRAVHPAGVGRGFFGAALRLAAAVPDVEGVVELVVAVVGMVRLMHPGKQLSGG
jgi:hypothetical protein